LRLYYCDHYSIPLPAGHKFPAGKYGILRGLLSHHDWFELCAAPLARAEEIELAHNPEYVRAILDGSIDPHVMRRIGFPWSEQLVQRTLASVGGTLAAARDAMRTGVGGNLAGGTHHAFRTHGAGFCVFNDLAITVHVLRREGLARRAAVLDLDVHQGDGTAEIFAGDEDVMTVSMHGQNNFPFRKQQSSIDIALPDGTGDADYLAALRDVLPGVTAFRPDVLLYQSGVDALAGDSLGRLAVTASGLADRDRLVFEIVRKHTIPLVITLGGGYAHPLDRTATAHAQTFHVLRQVLGVSEPMGREKL
jgi:acetoin utilization deacetylase AcuC-like enzyme